MSEANTIQLTAKIPAFYRTQKTSLLSVSWCRWLQPTICNAFYFISILILSPHLRIGFPMVYFFQVSPTNTCTCFYFPRYMLHAPPISFSLISWGVQVTKHLLVILLQCPVSFSLLGPHVFSLHNLYFTEYSQRVQAKEDETIWECSMHSSNALSVRNFFGVPGSVAHMVTRIWSDRSGVRTRVAQRRSERAWDSPRLLFHEYGGFFLV